MKKLLHFILIISLLPAGCKKSNDVPVTTYSRIVDHRYIDISKLPVEKIALARQKLHIAYGHTSHGSQLTDGMTGLATFKGPGYAWNNGGTNGALDLHDNAMSGDLGAPDFTTWATLTRNYLNANSDVNVIIWSWCGQLSSASQQNVETYLSLMSQLEKDFPAVTFVYMTGHLDGTGVTGNLNTRNEQIRTFCKTNNKFLFDFADIESYDPDGNYYLDKKANDGCYYDSDNNGSLDANWAVSWQNSHAVGVDWYNCSSAHSQPLNANRKAYGAWYLWVAVAAR